MNKKTTTHTALKVNDLSIGYRNKNEMTVIAKELDFQLEQGELAAIVGVNGIGKSTLLRTLGNVQSKLSGSIQLDGKDLKKHSPIELASTISVVLTEPLASKNLTVLELIALGRQPYTNWIGRLSETDKTKIKEAISMIGLENLKNKKCYELSDGQLQRVMIARALSQDTSIILLDEPTSHLDLHHKVQILKLLKHIAHHTQKTILFTSHEIEMTIQLCDKILIMNKESHDFGEPCELIQKQAFERLFPSDTVTFDAKTGSFKIKK
ncbi:ABC transporter ATP-binding protein [Maribacter luteus]|uniref:ABC transporter ATP-binding protein n=1 Tax=Maribacter luteus TaxID=2594478 RepID=UPI002490983E|nr:ABC transporter ATP-binding protein [Maribacter luteus]